MRRKRTSGFIILALAAGVVVLLAVMGLTVDIGRMYITKNEAQSYADSAALSAALKLDGTQTGIQAANDAVIANVNRWQFRTSVFTDTLVDFSQNGLDGWDPAPADPTGFTYARVIATAQRLPVYFLRVTGVPGDVDIRALAIAGQLQQSSFTENSTSGIFPFSPTAHAEGNSSTEVLASDPTGNFGFIPGQMYTFRWASNSDLDKKENVCPGDKTVDGTTNGTPTEQWIIKTDGQGNAERGYIQETSASQIRDAIEGDAVIRPVTLDEQVDMTGGAKGAEGKALENRVAQDSDPFTNGYAEYLLAENGSGRRVVTVAVNSGPRDNAGTLLPEAERDFVVGFAQFFLHNVNYPAAGNQPWCAEYIGPGALTGSTSNTGAGGNGLGGYVVRLVE